MNGHVRQLYRMNVHVMQLYCMDVHVMQLCRMNVYVMQLCRMNVHVMQLYRMNSITHSSTCKVQDYVKLFLFGIFCLESLREEDEQKTLTKVEA